MLMRKMFLSLCAFLLMFLATTSVSHGEGTINIGVIGPMKYIHGQEVWNGAVLAADEINGRGGVRIGSDLVPIKLIKVDSNEYLSVTTAVNAIEMLFFNNHVDFVVGGFRSEAVMAMQDVAMDHKKIFISAGAAASILTQRVAQNYERYKYYFRGGTFTDYNLGKACFLQLGHVAQKMGQKLGQRQIKVAIAAERAGWVDSMIVAAEKTLPLMGLELAGVFRTSSVSMDVSPTIRAIADTDAPIVLTLFSSNVGVAFAAQAADLNLPAVLVGINAEAQNKGFWDATGGKANYVITMSAFAPGVEISNQTQPFVERYQKKYRDVPGYTAGGAYTAIACTLAPSIEQSGTLDPDILVEIIEKRKYETPHGIYKYIKDKLGRHLHDIQFGADYALPVAIQWQDGEMKGVWPNDYRETPDAAPFSYRGVVDFEIPEWVIKEHKRF